MFLTKEDYLKIEAYLKNNAKKDSDFEPLEKDSNGNIITDFNYIYSTALGDNDRVVVNHDLLNGKFENRTLNLKNVLTGLFASNIIPDDIQLGDNIPNKYKDKFVTALKIWQTIKRETTNIPFNHLASNVQTSINSAIKKITVNGSKNPVVYTNAWSQGIIGTLSADINIPYAGLANGEVAGGKAKSAATADVADRVAKSLTIGNSGKSFNGSSNVTITASDLGINLVFNWVGLSPTYPMTEGVIMPEVNAADFVKGTIVHYNDPNPDPSTNKDYSGDYIYVSIEGGHPENKLNWEPLSSSTTGFVIAEQFNDFLDEIYTRFGVGGEDNEDNIEHRVAALNTALGTKYTKPSNGIPKSDLSLSIQDSLDSADSAYHKPDSGIPVGDLTLELLNSIDYANRYQAAVENDSLEQTSRKIDDWASIESSVETDKERSYPTARLVKNSIDELSSSIETLKEIFGDNIEEFLSKIQKTTISLSPDKTIAEIDGSADNDTITFIGKLLTETFGDYGTKTIDPLKFDRCQLIIDNDFWNPVDLTMVTNTTVGPNAAPANTVALSYGMVGTLEVPYSTSSVTPNVTSEYYVRGSKTFVESESSISNHEARLYIEYNNKSYNASCNIVTSLRKFFFFAEDISSTVNDSLMGGNNNDYSISEGNNANVFNFIGEITGNPSLVNTSHVTINGTDYTGTSHFSTSKGCTITVPASGDTNKYIYFLIPDAMVGSGITVTQPDAFNAAFELCSNSNYPRVINRILANPNYDGTDNTLEYYIYRYWIFRSKNSINSNTAKRLTIS